MKKDCHFINSFILKIIGMVSMIFDHFCAVGEYCSNIAFLSIETITAFRIIGRFSFVLFAFLTVEGVLHSRHKEIYLIRLFSLAVLMDVGMAIVSHSYIGNPITTLALGALFVYLLERKEVWAKCLAVLPAAVILLTALEYIPLQADYDLYGFCAIAVFYIAYLISKYSSRYIVSWMGLDEDTFLNSTYALTLRNSLSCILFFSYALAIYFINPVWNGTGLFTEMNSIQIYAVFALIPIFFYNGKRGYNAKWFQYGCYAFFPLHLIFLYLLFAFMI